MSFWFVKYNNCATVTVLGFFTGDEGKQDVPYDDSRKSAQPEDDKQWNADNQEDIAGLIAFP